MNGNRKKVFITVNPDLIKGKRLSTIRSVVSALDKICDLRVIPVDSYNFVKKTVVGYRRVAGGHFEKSGTLKPAGDLWIVYSDGYWLDCTDFGFSRRLDFLDSQIELHEESIRSGRISAVVNVPQAEKNCLKSWLAEISDSQFNTVPTFLAKTILEVHQLFLLHGILVAKPSWGGSGFGIQKLISTEAIEKFGEILKTSSEKLTDYCFQKYVIGPEKRFWYADGQFAAARITHGRHTPWSHDAADFKVAAYDASFGSDFENDKNTADRLCQRALISVGSIDFIGSLVNEINGAGTTFTQYHGFLKIVDARKQLVDYFVSLASS